MSKAGMNNESAAQAPASEAAKLPAAFALVLATAVALSVHVHLIATDPQLGQMVISVGLQRELARRLAGGKLFLLILSLCLAVWLGGAGLVRLLSGGSYWRALLRWGWRFGWPASVGVFEALWSLGGIMPEPWALPWLAGLATLLPFLHWIGPAGFLAAWIMLLSEKRWRAERLKAEPGHEPAGSARQSSAPEASTQSGWRASTAAVLLAAVLFAATFSTLAILQYRALLVPHGDTAMYEEHLWNLLHGKGFRSQLDGGRLFLGEHLQLFHVLLIPIYILYPCLPTLNVCLSVGLAAGAIAVWRLARRLSGNEWLAAMLAVAYLLYHPLQYLNLEASLKTFRPENFAVPLLLFALWALEARRFKTMLLLLGLALLCKEDYAVPAAMLGLYLAARGTQEGTALKPRRRHLALGLGLFAFNVLYLWFVLQVLIPYFRGGPPHYTGYFADLGATPEQIAMNLLAHPLALCRRLLTWTNLLLVLSLLASLGGLPLLGYGRLWVCLPSFVVIAISQLEATHTPLFHFHAPLVPVIFWSAAEALGRLQASGPKLFGQRAALEARAPSGLPVVQAATFTLLCSLSAGFWAGKSPLSLSFYDRYSGITGYWRALYVPTRRVEVFWKQVYPLVPVDASVAASDYVRPRFTHHRFCHEFGRGGLKPHVSPDQVDYIVIDLLGPFSDPIEGQVIGKQWQDVMHEWEVAYNDAIYFIVVRKKEGLAPSHPPAKKPVLARAEDGGVKAPK